jgi:hypothetical protein
LREQWRTSVETHQRQIELEELQKMLSNSCSFRFAGRVSNKPVKSRHNCWLSFSKQVEVVG